MYEPQELSSILVPAGLSYLDQSLDLGHQKKDVPMHSMAFNSALNHKKAVKRSFDLWVGQEVLAWERIWAVFVHLCVHHCSTYNVDLYGSLTLCVCVCFIHLIKIVCFQETEYVYYLSYRSK